MPLLRITQQKSKIRCIEKHKRTIEALGLRRIRHSVIHEDTPQIRGMIAAVSYLVRVEPADAGAAKPAPPAKPAKPARRATPKAAAGAKAPRARTAAKKKTATKAKGGETT